MKAKKTSTKRAGANTQNLAATESKAGAFSDLMIWPLYIDMGQQSTIITANSKTSPQLYQYPVSASPIRILPYKRHRKDRITAGLVKIISPMQFGLSHSIFVFPFLPEPISIFISGLPNHLNNCSFEINGKS